MTRSILATADRGHRYVTGTSWPILDQVERVQLPGRRPEWIVTRGLCNGIPASSESFATRRAALEAL